MAAKLMGGFFCLGRSCHSRGCSPTKASLYFHFLQFGWTSPPYIWSQSCAICHLQKVVQPKVRILETQLLEKILLEVCIQWVRWSMYLISGLQSIPKEAQCLDRCLIHALNVCARKACKLYKIYITRPHWYIASLVHCDQFLVSKPG